MNNYTVLFTGLTTGENQIVAVLEGSQVDLAVISKAIHIEAENWALAYEKGRAIVRTMSTQGRWR